MGNYQMMFGAVMVLDVMATLKGVAPATLGGVAGTTLGDVGLGWGIGLARHNGGELTNGIEMFQFGSGLSWDCTS
jgi:hypothetical protein